MSWRVVSISNPAKLSLMQDQFVIEQKEKVSIPIEDVSVVILDSYGILLTVGLIEDLSLHKVTIIICDKKHLPIAHILPYEQHSRQLRITQQQLALSEPFKKRLWQLIIRQKIINQGHVLKLLGLKDPVSHLVEAVKSGDSDNREGYASRLYFIEIFEKGTTRRSSNKLNSGFNYGYAIIRSVIARSLASYGFLTSQGIHHENDLNNYNLADDFIEPFRPIVDFYVCSLLKQSQNKDEELNKEERVAIIDILNKYAIMDDGKHVIKNAIELTVKSFSSCCLAGDFKQILLPSIDVYNDEIYENYGDV